MDEYIAFSEDTGERVKKKRGRPLGSTKRSEPPQTGSTSQLQLGIESILTEIQQQHGGLSSKQTVDLTWSRQQPSSPPPSSLQQHPSTVTSASQLLPSVGQPTPFLTSAARLAENVVGQQNAHSSQQPQQQQPFIVSQMLNMLQQMQASSQPSIPEPYTEPTKQPQSGRVCKMTDCSFCGRDPCGVCGNCLHHRRNKCIRRYLFTLGCCYLSRFF